MMTTQMTAAEVDRWQRQANENAEIAEHWQKEAERMRAALKPFADLASKLDGAPNLIGLLTEDDFRRAAEALTDEQSASQSFTEDEAWNKGRYGPPERDPEV